MWWSSVLIDDHHDMAADERLRSLYFLFTTSLVIWDRGVVIYIWMYAVMLQV